MAENDKPKPSLDRVAAAMNRYLVPALLAQPKKTDKPTKNKSSHKSVK